MDLLRRLIVPGGTSRATSGSVNQTTNNEIEQTIDRIGTTTSTSVAVAFAHPQWADPHAMGVAACSAVPVPIAPVAVAILVVFDAPTVSADVAMPAPHIVMTTMHLMDD